ncbi:MAG: magnesium transporter CorA family protein [Bacteroidales bacterium]
MITYLRNNNGLAFSEKWEPKCWINVEEPTSDEKNYLLNTLKIPEAYFNDIEDIDERPRVEVDEGWYLVLTRIPFKSNDKKLPFSTVPLGLIFKDEVFVSICFHKTEMVTDFINYTRRKQISKQGNFDLALRLILSSSVWYLKYLKQINQNIKLAEDKLEKSVRNEDLQTLLQIEKCLVFFTTSLKGNDVIVNRIKNIRELRETLDQELLEDVDIELKQALDTTNIHSEILSGMMDAYASVISNNISVIMKQLTSISIILMIPTLIASLYGMNVPNFFQDNPIGFWIILLISFSVAALTVIVFINRKWF